MHAPHRTTPPQQPHRLLNAQLLPSPARFSVSRVPVTAPVAPMSPLEHLITVIWDWSGARRRQQQLRIARSRRTLRKYDRANERAMNQIRRTHEVVAPLVVDQDH